MILYLQNWQQSAVYEHGLVERAGPPRSNLPTFTPQKKQRRSSRTRLRERPVEN